MRQRPRLKVLNKAEVLPFPENPNGADASVLQHILGQHATMPPDRGVFLSQPRRMHPDVCAFISDHIYDGRLTSHPSCAVQNTGAGTGLRWLQARN